ncbi:hypothetical protein [Nocardiopsis sp. CA-288880]|uniref:hypothetical protein n=1 Tax=Nocardiopsis sp. CA-288880 TaxID=3239995 RepID=UPI003D96F7B6
MTLPRPLLAPAALLVLALTACGGQDTAPDPEPSPTADASASPSPEGLSQEALEQQEIDTVSACTHARMAAESWDVAAGVEPAEPGVDADSTITSLTELGDIYAGTAADFLTTATPEAREAVADQASPQGMVAVLREWCLDTGVIDEEGEPIDPPPGYEPPAEAE